MEATRAREAALREYQALRSQGHSLAMARAMLQETYGLTEAQLDDIAPMEKAVVKRGPPSAMELRTELRGVAAYLRSVARRLEARDVGRSDIAGLAREAVERAGRIERALDG